jgi:choloylglycine hydrolase
MRVLAAALALCAFAPGAFACTTFCFEKNGARVFGKNYDWNVGDGLVFVNKRGVAKTAFTADNPAAWTSRFGSVTFNQYGREFPSGGINEKGLVVELMWLDETVYPEPDRRRALPTLQWIQYQLDNAATVDDVLASNSKVRIAEAGSARIHFLIADATGAVATVEYIDGRMVSRRGEKLPYPVLTNDMYDVAVTHLQHTSGPATTHSSLDRFARASKGLAGGNDAVTAAFALLDDVAQGEFTQWSIVYDIGEKRAYFRTQSNRAIRFIDVGTLDLSCASPVRVMDMHAKGAGDAAPLLVDYTSEANRKLVGAAFAKTEFLRGVPAEEIDALVHYPESTSCRP